MKSWLSKIQNTTHPWKSLDVSLPMLKVVEQDN